MCMPAARLKAMASHRCRYHGGHEDLVAAIIPFACERSFGAYDETPKVGYSKIDGGQVSKHK
eukprot:7680221-Alexandrium_andersonii.AAC.1